MGLFKNLPGNPTQDGFADRVAKALQAAHPNVQPEYDKENFRLLLFEDGRQFGVANLGNGYAEYCNLASNEREAHVRRVVRSILSFRKEVPDDFEDAKPDLLPTLRNRSYFELTRLEARLEHGQELSWPYQEIGEHLGLSLVYDLPEAMCGIRQDTLNNWGVSFYSAMEVARHNLDEREAKLGRMGDGLYVTVTADCYDASRLILLDKVRRFPVSGDHIAMVPTRDCLLITGSDDDAGLRAMIELAAKTYQAKSHAMTLHAFRLDGEEWVPWLPGPSHELHSKFRESAVQFLGSDYAEQKKLLDRMYEKEGIDEFVANFSGGKRKSDDCLVTYCVWSQNIVSLLPKTDFVMFLATTRKKAILSRREAGTEWPRSQAT